MNNFSNIDSDSHLKGQSNYIDDIQMPENGLYAQIFYLKIAHANIMNLDFTQALKQEGIVAIYTAKDIPGLNYIGETVLDGPIFAEMDIQYFGQPIAMVVGESDYLCRKAMSHILYETERLPVVYDARTAYSSKNFLFEPLIFSNGDIEKAFDECDHVIHGKTETGGQEHLYLESQGSIAFFSEQTLKIISSTQNPTAIQKITALALGLEMHQIEVDVTRLGGGFGGKEDQATPWAVMCALAAYKLRRPVKLVLNRIDDMRMTGKRHPYSSDFKIGLNSKGKILAYEVSFYQNGGAYRDLSLAVLYRTLFHATGAYFIPNVKITGYSCRTNLPPNTAFRGFGGPQAMFVIEAAIRAAAEKMNLEAEFIQRHNLLQEGSEFYYGQVAKNCHAQTSWDQAQELFQLEKQKKLTNEFNEKYFLFKKGFAVMPICFGISFTKTSLNQASALVHIYQDGSVSVATGAVEMGQGVNSKILHVASKTLGIPFERIKILSTNTSRVANSSPTAGSTGTDLNGEATIKACIILKNRLTEFGKTLNMNLTEQNWNEIISCAYLQRIKLSEHAFYATPKIFFNYKKNKGSPFAYHVYGTAYCEVSIDCLRGRYTIDKVQIVHDFGKALNTNIDTGQIEGALAQGIGWLTIEDLRFDTEGIPMSDTLSTYKIPDIDACPRELIIKSLQETPNDAGLLGSKAIGEPPIVYGLSIYFALREAMKAFVQDREIPFEAPLTPEQVLLTLYG